MDNKNNEQKNKFTNNKEEQFVDEIELLINKLKGITLQKESDLSRAILIAMKFMSTFKNLHGLSKKIIVIEALKKLVEISKLNNKQDILNIIDIMAPPIIDTIAEVSKFKISLNPSTYKCGCFSIEKK